MAVHAQYPSSNLLLFNNIRNETETTKDHQMDYPQQQQPPPLFFHSNGVNGNQGKRGREAPPTFQMVPTPQMQMQMNLFPSPSSIQSPCLINLPRLQVSTGLRLSSFDGDDNNNNQSQNQEDDLSSLINQQKLEIEQYLVTQGEQLRRALAERQRAHYRALLAAAEEIAARKLKEKEVELSRAAEKSAELETTIARLRTETLTWQAKATSDQSMVESLHARIRQANKRPGRVEKGSAAAAAVAEDCESAYVDPNRVEDGKRTCRVCRVSEVSVVVLPCRHLCLCVSCDADNGVCCPVCNAVKGGSVQVFLS